MIFLDILPKLYGPTSKKLNKSNLIKSNNFCATNDTIYKVKNSGCVGPPPSLTPAPFTQDPFHHPMFDNNDSYLGKPWASKKLPYKNPTHPAHLYNHHTGTFKNKNEILLHQKTSQDTHGIIKIQFAGETLHPPPPPSITSWTLDQLKEVYPQHPGVQSVPSHGSHQWRLLRKNDGGFFST
uniref:Uncharacterized protein n=1 Tax=Suricata suricatta TaxID=37032 RepID=A0A673V1C8_SURSU